MSSNPFDSTTAQVCITGENLFRLFKFQDGTLKLIHQMKFDQEIRTHAWVSTSKVVCGTADSKIMLFENGELISEIQYLPIPDPKSDADAPVFQPAVTVCHIILI